MFIELWGLGIIAYLVVGLLLTLAVHPVGDQAAAACALMTIGWAPLMVFVLAADGYDWIVVRWRRSRARPTREGDTSHPLRRSPDEAGQAIYDALRESEEGQGSKTCQR